MVLQIIACPHYCNKNQSLEAITWMINQKTWSTSEHMSEYSSSMYYKAFSKKIKPFIFIISALKETYTWDVQAYRIWPWAGSPVEKVWDERWWNHWVYQDLNTMSNSQEDQELTPAGRGYTNRCDDGDSWVLPFVFHLHVLESFFLSTASFCSSQFEVFLLTITIFWHLSHLPFFSAAHSMDFLCFISSSPFLPSFVPCLFLHKFILVAGHNIKYCRNRRFLWNIIKDRMWTDDIMAFSPGKKKGQKLFHCMSILNENCAGQKPGGGVTPCITQILHSSQAGTKSILKVTFPLEQGQKSVCFDKVFQSFSEKWQALVGPLQQPDFLWDFNSFSHQSHSLQYSYCVLRGSCTYTENFLWAWLWQRHVDGGVINHLSVKSQN